MIRHLKRKSEFEDIGLYTTKIRHVKKKKEKKKEPTMNEPGSPLNDLISV